MTTFFVDSSFSEATDVLKLLLRENTLSFNDALHLGLELHFNSEYEVYSFNII